MFITAAVLLLLSASHPDAGVPADKLGALKASARALIKTTGCTKASQCKQQPMGNRPCGGPSEFLVYCAATTDEKKLKQKAQLVTDAEKSFNSKSQLMGTCDVLAAPKLKLESSECLPDRAKSADLPM